MNMNTSKKQEGFVLVVLAIVLLALVGFLALAVDIGVLYSARTSAQGVADAAALAGAFTFINDTPIAATADGLRQRAPGGPQQLHSGPYKPPPFISLAT